MVGTRTVIEFVLTLNFYWHTAPCEVVNLVNDLEIIAHRLWQHLNTLRQHFNNNLFCVSEREETSVRKKTRRSNYQVKISRSFSTQTNMFRWAIYCCAQHGYEINKGKHRVKTICSILWMVAQGGAKHSASNKKKNEIYTKICAVVVVSKTNNLNSRARTLFVTKDFDPRAHV